GLSPTDRSWLIGGGLVLLALFVWVFWINLLGLVSVFARDASWSHGFVVPFLSGMIVYLNADKLRGLAIRRSWLGLAILVYGVFSHVMFRITGQSHMSNLSMLVVLFGAVLFVLGWDYLRTLWLPIAFLLFMVPPPSTLYVKLTTPMQNIAAGLGVHLLPLFGVQAVLAGTTLKVRGGAGGTWDPLVVAEACSGIRMLVAFGALAVVLAYTTPRPMWQKAFLAISAAPVAIFCNALRVTLTGVMDVYLGAKYAHGSSHEMLGFLMLIPAGLMQIGLAKLLDRMFIEVPDDEPHAAPAAGPMGGGGQKP
ncbi:MAG: exosortase/archaeosortase family protein, partial [Phycisphaerae bacterium]